MALRMGEVTAVLHCLNRQSHQNAQFDQIHNVTARPRPVDKKVMQIFPGDPLNAGIRDYKGPSCSPIVRWRPSDSRVDATSPGGHRRQGIPSNEKRQSRPCTYLMTTGKERGWGSAAAEPTT